MAVCKMKKFQLLGYLPLKERIVDTLRELGAVHITDLKSRLLSSEENLIEDVEIKDSLLEERFSKLQYIMAFTSAYQEKPNMVESLLNPKIIVSQEEIEELSQSFDLDGMYQRCLDLENKMKTKEGEKNKKTTLLEELTPWKPLNLQLEEIIDTERVRICLGIIRLNALDTLREELNRITPEIELQLVNTVKNSAYVLIAFSRDFELDIMDALKKGDFRPVDFRGLSGTPAEIIHRLERELEEIDSHLLSLQEEAKELAKQRDKVLILYDHTRELLEKKRVQNNFAHTSETFMIEGWIKAKDEKLIRRRLSRISPEIELITSPPGKDENPPVELENKPVVAPFEFVTTLYGRPAYKELDPTPLLAPFFILFFALCLTDGGYGLTLAAIALLGMKKLKGGPGADKLFRLLFLGGIVTAVVGAFTGGLFGVELGQIAEPLKRFVLINPLQNPLKMLNLAFALGVIQILFGISIKMYSNIREGNYLSALLDQFLWIVFLIFLVPLGYKAILGGKVSQEVLAIAKKGALICLIALVLTQGRRQKNPILKLVMGIAKLYDIVGYFGDVLSYARLLALGLATSAIALAINGIAKMALSMPFYIGYIVALFILIGGHLFNLAINSLGGFVHSGRLQYLEFFSKFFQGGGTEFKPFKEENQYIVVKKRTS